MMILTLSVFVTVIATVSAGGWTPPPTTTWPTEPPIILTQRQKDLIVYCSLNCKYEECPLPTDLNDCRLYVRCVLQPDGSYFGFDQACPIGTKHLKDGRCVNAPNDPCLDVPCATKPNGYTEAYPDERCNTFIECQYGKSEPYCCASSQQYNETLGACVPDISCASGCPLQPLGVCDSEGVTTAPGENCASYVKCVLDVAEKRCCSYGFSYNDNVGSCMPDATCQQTCNAPIPKTCATGVQGYSTPDSCGSYIECRNGRPYQRKCCKYGEGWNDATQMCERLDVGRNCVLECPPKHTYPCPLKAVPGFPNVFMRPPNTQVETCADGTLYSQDDCTCIKNPLIEENACHLELGLDFKNGEIEKSGSEKWSYIGERGVKSDGMMYDGFYTFKFDLYALEIPLYQAEFHQFTFNVVFYPESNNYRTILLSNCLESPNVPQPSLELTVDQVHATLRFRTDKPGNNVFNVGVRIGVNTWNSLTAVYTGEIAYVQNEYDETSNSNSISAEGTIPQAVTGLNCGGCGDINTSFKGSIAKYKFSRCVDPVLAETLPIGI